MKPTDQQKLILDCNTNAVVIASPGSGKTFTISQKIKQNLKLLKDYQGVIAISYTNKASNELKTRSLSNGENPKGSFFGTIDRFYLSEIVIPFGKHLFGSPSNELEITTAKSLTDGEKENFGWLDKKITYIKISKGTLHLLKSYFQDGKILLETVGLLANYIFKHSPACQKYLKSRYTHIYIDEYQDSGLAQHKLFLKIKNLGVTAVAVGDLNQSIYAFSGKDSKFLLELSKDETFKYFKLDKNHRCHSSIINYSNYLLNPKTELLKTEDNLVYFFRIKGNEKNIAAWIDDVIENIETSFKVEKRNQIAILTRGNRTGEIIDSSLKAPHKRFISNDLDKNLNIWSGIFSGLFRYLHDKSFKFIEVIELFTAYEKFNKTNLKKLKTYKEKLDNYFKKDTFNKKKVVDCFIHIATLIAPNAYNRESIDLLFEVLSSQELLNSYKPAADNQVNIMTIHKSKGLEFDVVLHLDLYEWILPNKRPGPNNDFNNLQYGNWQQDINLHYVGLTRAKKGCLLISSTLRTNYENKTKNGKDSEFIFLKDIEKLRNQKK